MKRVAAFLGCCLFVSTGCGGGGAYDVDGRTVEEEFVGGWDAEGSDGTAILLVREGLIGTLNITSLTAADRQFHVLFDIQGEVDDEEFLQLNLNCSEARERLGAPQVDTGAPERIDEDEAAEEWLSLDCSGWDLQLECSLAGECSGDCNMVCDVVFFGDAYAHNQMELGSVEDAFDYWQRV